MSSAATVAVAGAGIAGITAAYFEARRGSRVVLLEPAATAGGLLRSDCNEYGCFDYGTHVSTYTGVDALDEFLFGAMTDADFICLDPGEAGNYFAGQLSDVSPFLDVRCLPAADRSAAEQELLARADPAPAANLEQELVARFGSTLYERVFRAVNDKLWGQPAATLAPEAVYLFDLSRVLAFDAERTAALKRELRYDQILGFHDSSTGSRKRYPRRGGMGYWVSFLLAKLEDLDVDIRLGQSIDRVAADGGCVTQLTLGDEVLKVDRLVWSAPPALFARSVGREYAAPPPLFRKTLLFDFAFTSPFGTQCYYVNVPDPRMLSARVTMYSNLTDSSGYHACTVEVLADDDVDAAAALPLVRDELRQMGLVDAQNRCAYAGTRRVERGFAVPEAAGQRAASVAADELDAAFANVAFVGRGPQRFFMRDVLVDAFQKCGTGATALG